MEQRIASINGALQGVSARVAIPAVGELRLLAAAAVGALLIKASGSKACAREGDKDAKLALILSECVLETVGGVAGLLAHPIR